jgi:Tfp pilus assembly protein PilN
MLEINLLAPVRRRRRLNAPLLITSAVTVSMALVTGLSVWSYDLLARVNRLHHELITASKEVTPLRGSARRVEELSHTAERMRLRQAFLQQLQTPQVPASEVLETIRSVIPRDVQLTSLTVGTSDVTLEGFAFSYPLIARFMTGLEHSGSLRRIALSMSQSGLVADRDVVKFQITGDLTGTPPVTSPEAATP